MADWTLSNILISILLLGGMISGITIFVGNLATNYNLNPGGEYNNTFNQLADTSEITKDIAGSVEDIDTRDPSSFDRVVTATLGSVKQVGKSSSFLFTIFRSVSQELGIPESILLSIVAIVTLVISFQIINIILKPFRPI